MANNPVVNTLTFTGSVAGQATVQAQGIAGNLTFLLPNTLPTVNQLLTVSSVNGSNVFIGWVSPQSEQIDLSQLAQAGATTDQVIQWNGTGWVPGTVSSGGVTTVFGRSGAVVAADGDYSVGQVTGAAALAGAAFTGGVSVTGGALELSFGSGNALIVDSGQSQFQGIVWINSELLDSNSTAGTSGQVLTSTGSAIAWANAPASGGIQNLHPDSPGDFNIDFSQGNVVFLYLDANINLTVSNFDAEDDVLYLTVIEGEAGNTITFDSGSFNTINEVFLPASTAIQYIFESHSSLFNQAPMAYDATNNGVGMQYITDTSSGDGVITFSGSLGSPAVLKFNSDGTSYFGNSMAVLSNNALYFAGNLADNDWGIGLDSDGSLPNTGFFTTSHVTGPSILKIVHGSGSTDGFAIGQSANSSDIEIDNNHAVWMSGALNVASILTAEALVGSVATISGGGSSGFLPAQTTYVITDDHTLDLEDATTLPAGFSFTVINAVGGTGTSNVTISQNGGSGPSAVVPYNTAQAWTLTDNTTANGTWAKEFIAAPAVYVDMSAGATGVGLTVVGDSSGSDVAEFKQVNGAGVQISGDGRTFISGGSNGASPSLSVIAGTGIADNTPYVIFTEPGGNERFFFKESSAVPVLEFNASSATIQIAENSTGTLSIAGTLLPLVGIQDNTSSTGTAGELLSAGPSGGDLTWVQPVTKYSVTIMSSASVLTLHSAPTVLFTDNQYGAGSPSHIVVESVTYQFIHSTTAYTLGANPKLLVSWGADSSVSFPISTLTATGILDSSTDVVADGTTTPLLAANGAITDGFNSVKVSFDNDAHTDPTLGDGALQVHVTYHVINLSHP